MPQDNLVTYRQATAINFVGNAAPRLPLRAVKPPKTTFRTDPVGADFRKRRFRGYVAVRRALQDCARLLPQRAGGLCRPEGGKPSYPRFITG